jgi:folate-dependent phosphoribosylglycinamide formyltransferase PurN
MNGKAKEKRHPGIKLELYAGFSSILVYHFIKHFKGKIITTERIKF